MHSDLRLFLVKYKESNREEGTEGIKAEEN